MSGVSGRELCSSSPRALSPAEQRPFCAQALARAHQRSGRCSSFPHGHWAAHGGQSPRWLWKQHSTQGVLLKRDNKELQWLFHRVFPQRKPARLNERLNPFIDPIGASGVMGRVPASQRNLAAGEGDHETSPQP